MTRPAADSSIPGTALRAVVVGLVHSLLEELLILRKPWLKSVGPWTFQLIVWAGIFIFSAVQDVPSDLRAPWALSGFVVFWFLYPGYLELASISVLGCFLLVHSAAAAALAARERRSGVKSPWSSIHAFLALAILPMVGYILFHRRFLQLASVARAV